MKLFGGQSSGSRFTFHVSRDSCHSPLATRQILRAFTLIEIMVVVLIMGIVLTMGVPIVYKMFHKAPMHQAIRDLVEVCENARRQAILKGQVSELVIHPQTRRFEVAGMSGSGTSVQLADGVTIDLLDINMAGRAYEKAEIAKVRFYPTGTSDEMKMVISYEMEQTGIELELSTGMANVVPNPMRAWSR